MEHLESVLDKYKETLEKLNFGKHTYKYLYEKKKNNEKIIGNEYRLVESDNCFIIYKQKNNEYSLFFYKPKEVKYINIEKSQSLIFSTLQIDEFIKQNLIEDLEFCIEVDNTVANYSYSKHKNYIKYIKGDVLNFTAITLSNENFELNNDILDEDKFSPLKLSKYFYEYFEYNKKLNEKDFVFYNTPERAQLMIMLQDFYFSELNYFKFCGPISGGKSTTLLKFKNQYNGIIYFNLKTIKKYYLVGNNIYKSIMSHELGRINTNDKTSKEVQEEINTIMEQNVLETIFIKIIEYLIDLNVRNILVIDQFKNIHFEYKTLKDIQKKILNTPIGIIISSSIDEKEIKRELELTLSKFNKMPKIITPQNQHYYFYVPDLLKNKIVRDEITSQIKITNELIDLYEQFSFKTKYISMLGAVEKLDEGIKEINKQITNKMGKQCLLPESISIEFIHLLINDNIEKAMEYKEENINLLGKIPLKYIDIDFNEKNFSFHYAFPYIKTLVEKTKKYLEINKYFEQKLYLDNFYSQFKGLYFEKAVNSSIMERKICFKEINNDEKIYKIIVNNILEMEENKEENDALSIINRIKNKDKNNLNFEKNYEDFTNGRIQKIENELNNIINNNNKAEVDLNIYFEKALKEELNILNKEKGNYEIIKGRKKLPDKYGKKNLINYDEEFKRGNILIEQTQTNGRCLDSAFLYGDENDKTLICLQMKFYEKSTTVSSKDKDKLNKPYIKSVCYKALSNIYLNYGIRVTNWHYILILHFDNETNSFNTNFVKICVDNDLEYIFYDPIQSQFYNKEKKEINIFNMNFLTNLNNNENESNFINCFLERKMPNSYLKKRNRDLEGKNSPKNIAQIDAINFEKKYGVSFNDFFLKIKNEYKYIKKIDIIISLSLDVNQNLPMLNEGYGYIFLNSTKDALIFEGKTKNNENNITLNSKKKDNIHPFQISNFIYIEEEFTFFVVKLS